MKIYKRLAGKVQRNDREFAEIQTVGIEGVEKDLLLDAIQIDRSDKPDAPSERLF